MPIFSSSRIVPSVAYTGILYFDAKTRRPFTWSPCSWVTKTAPIFLSLTPMPLSFSEICFALTPASISTPPPEEPIYVQFPLLDEKSEQKRAICTFLIFINKNTAPSCSGHKEFNKTFCASLSQPTCVSSNGLGLSSSLTRTISAPRLRNLPTTLS